MDGLLAAVYYISLAFSGEGIRGELAAAPGHVDFYVALCKQTADAAFAPLVGESGQKINLSVETSGLPCITTLLCF